MKKYLLIRINERFLMSLISQKALYLTSMNLLEMPTREMVPAAQVDHQIYLYPG